MEREHISEMMLYGHFSLLPVTKRMKYSLLDEGDSSTRRFKVLLFNAQSIDNIVNIKIENE